MMLLRTIEHPQRNFNSIVVYSRVLPLKVAEVSVAIKGMVFTFGGNKKCLFLTIFISLQ